MDDETENISPHSQKGRNSVHNTGFTLIGVLISVHETGLGVFSVSTKWDWGQILCPHLWVHYILILAYFLILPPRGRVQIGKITKWQGRNIQDFVVIYILEIK